MSLNRTFNQIVNEPSDPAPLINDIDAIIEQVNTDALQLGELNTTVQDLTLNKADQTDLDIANANIALKANTTYVQTLTNALASGAPKGIVTLEALIDKYPDGAVGIYVSAEDNHWYYWDEDEEAWTDGGEYPSSLSSFSNMWSNSNVATTLTTTLTSRNITIANNGIWVNHDDYNVIYQQLNIVAGNVYFTRLKVVPVEGNKVDYRLRLYYSDDSLQLVDGIRSEDYSEVYGNITAEKTDVANLLFRFMNVGTYTRTNQLFVNLSDLFGPGNEPEPAEFMDILAYFPDYWFDTQVESNIVQGYLLKAFIEASRREAVNSFTDEDTGITYQYTLKQVDGFVVFDYEEV